MSALVQALSNRLRALRESSKEAIRIHGVDILCSALVGGLTLIILYEVPVPSHHYIPMIFNDGGLRAPLEYLWPDRNSLISPLASGFICCGVPILVYLIGQIRIRSFLDLFTAVEGTLWSMLISTFFHVLLKQLVGGLRPSFLNACKPVPNPGPSYLVQEGYLPEFGVDFFTTNVCSGEHANWALTSWPSGHATAAFSGFVYLTLWMNAKLKVLADHRPSFWRLFVTLLPMLAALYMNGIITVDHSHHWSDIITGILIGTFIAFAAYRSSYAAIWDWRYNHLPLEKMKPFPYNDVLGLGLDNKRGTFTHAAGWGAPDVPLLGNTVDDATKEAIGAAGDIGRASPIGGLSPPTGGLPA
ncbi:hypothetical protein B0I35DRAFT_359342 [Stachybotrys elegans]|uniref:Phosphatidic acid phosphatase type 2/haloperoxidase domain-containing protein n=1 Tax=Stachybotrys elegans TaxID=80388 RepID=A0A8K0SJ74_9HYPO|nr:hypothetical protein B0I35DRAFT_359342 [Stachybotrys elegans]